ncbi:hypothetical protein R3P38DRAFT_3005135 [Favolaschia claudopus]|uniref:Uncharacterized protein n=1 Tax=Favolaschia claudopus TaxID=2862362 RepID=A0AAW0AM87_9AGAR
MYFMLRQHCNFPPELKIFSISSYGISSAAFFWVSRGLWRCLVWRLFFLGAFSCISLPTTWRSAG